MTAILNRDELRRWVYKMPVAECGTCKHWGGRNSYGEVVTSHASCDLGVELSGGRLPSHFGCVGHARAEAGEL